MVDDATPEEWDRRERPFRGISRRLAARYLRNLGGEFADADKPMSASEIESDDWRATLATDTVEIGQSLTLTEVTVTFEGEPSVLDRLIEEFRRKAMRAGG
ncbi:hypothetical protein AArcSl_1229 [Halalkaliarchaeum desulfuricum]|uniref:Molybdopterin cofactor biosynthesis MoaD-related C-terminal domain-containing protein n=1 Tax=Halalkaliarchaeum desulfuricum TaxID=2055893 RepID=A0A343TIE0_9EURY|nr:hypothetical protein [Halalkaliarchaeum desulfuricum]AUX08862.1 hypothetical protein AArcSl_1229 [Halalkaliarchaeum desulfuricum]